MTPRIDELFLRLATTGEEIRCSLTNGEEELCAEGYSPLESLQTAIALATELIAPPAPQGSDALLNLGRTLSKIALPDALLDEICRMALAGPVRLGLKVPEELSDLPWECLYADRANIGFLGLHPAMRVYRYSLPGCAQASKSGNPSVLVATADPRSRAHPGLAGSDAEFKSILSALSAAECGRIDTHALEHATPSSLDRALVELRPQVVHFIGHGDIKPSGGLLVFESGRQNEELPVYAEDLAKSLLAAGTQLVVLSSCLSAGLSTSVGAELVVHGVPAVIGMQLPVEDTDAHLFARSFYSALGAGHSLEEAVYEGRMAIRGSGIGWVAPVLMTAEPAMCLLPAERKRALIRGNLPRPITSFIGRRAEIEEVEALLGRDRLVVLLGSGGIGKTRLSVEIGRKVGPEFSNGVWQVLLENVTDPALVVDAIAAAFSIRDSSEKPIEQRLFEFLTDQNLLLILDNCEHLTGACRDVALRILRDCPTVSILATSREVLGTGAETVVRVPPLSYPEIGEDEELVDNAEELVGKYEALELFVSRAKNADPKFSISDANILDLCRIAKRLDGIPLAIELAASRVRSFTLRQMREKLSNDLAWLDLENPGAVPRHKTLRATLDWSYRLLSQKEKTLFNRLSIFPAGFALDAVVAVEGSEPRAQIEDTLESLVDRSLVIAEQFNDEMAYRLLDTCHVYAREALERSDDVDALRNRHLAFVLSLTRALYEEMKKEGFLLEWQVKMAKAQPNVSAALEWALSKGQAPETAAEIILNCILYWTIAGDDAETQRRVFRVLTSLPASEELLHARLSLELGILLAQRGDSSQMRPMLAAHEIIKRKAPELVRYASHKVGNAAYDLGQDDIAISMFRDILETCRQDGNLLGEGSVQRRLAYMELARGNFEEAYAHLIQHREHKDLLGDPFDRGTGYCDLAYVERLLGCPSWKDDFRKGISILIPMENLGAIPDYLALASCIFLDNDLTLAAKLQGLAQRLREELCPNPERFTTPWSDQIVSDTRDRLADYDRWAREGRTMGLDEALFAFES